MALTQCLKTMHWDNALNKALRQDNTTKQDKALRQLQLHFISQIFGTFFKQFYLHNFLAQLSLHNSLYTKSVTEPTLTQGIKTMPGVRYYEV